MEASRIGSPFIHNNTTLLWMTAVYIVCLMHSKQSYIYVWLANKVLNTLPWQLLHKRRQDPWDTLHSKERTTLTSYEHHGVSNHIECLFNNLFRLTWKKTSKPAILALCEGTLPANAPMTGGFPSQRGSNAECLSIHGMWLRMVFFSGQYL